MTSVEEPTVLHDVLLSDDSINTLTPAAEPCDGSNILTYNQLDVY